MGHPFLNIKLSQEYNLITGVNPLLGIGEKQMGGRQKTTLFMDTTRKEMEEEARKQASTTGKQGKGKKRK